MRRAPRPPRGDQHRALLGERRLPHRHARRRVRAATRRRAGSRAAWRSDGAVPRDSRCSACRYAREVSASATSRKRRRSPGPPATSTTSARREADGGQGAERVGEARLLHAVERRALALARALVAHAHGAHGRRRVEFRAHVKRRRPRSAPRRRHARRATSAAAAGRPPPRAGWSCRGRCRRRSRGRPRRRRGRAWPGCGSRARRGGRAWAPRARPGGCQRPVKVAGRFSRNAVIPSRMSSVAESRPK